MGMKTQASAARLFFNGSYTPRTARWVDKGQAASHSSPGDIDDKQRGQEDRRPGPLVRSWHLWFSPLFGRFCQRQRQDKPRPGCCTSSGGLSRGRSLHVM